MHDPPILVTGSHRSGTTWVGRILDAVPGLTTIHEPFSPMRSPGIFSHRFGRWFAAVTPEEEESAAAALADTVRFRYGYRAGLAAAGTPGEYRQVTLDAWSFQRARLLGDSAVLKDPIALLSAEWIAARFDARVVIMIRHPAAFAASLKRMDWRFDFRNLLEQPRVLERLPGEQSDRIRGAAASPPGMVEHAALLWAVLYEIVRQYRTDHGDWQFVRHEDLARDPMEGFQALFRGLELPWIERVGRAVTRYSSAGNPVAAAGPMDVRRNSRSTVDRWRGELSPAEVAAVRRQTEAVASEYYRESEW